MVRFLMYLLPIAIAIYAIADIARTEDSNIKHLPKWAWIIVSILFIPIGAIAWLIAGKTRYRRPPKKNGPKGPDDDPDFLKGL